MIGAMAAWRPKGVVAVIGGGYSAEVQQFYNRLVTPPVAASAWDTRYVGHINGCVTDSNWTSDIDCMAIFGAADVATGLVDLLGGGAWSPAALSGGPPTFTANVGFTCGVSLNGIVNSQFPDAVSHFSQASACVFAFADLSVQANRGIFLAFSGTSSFDNIELFPRWSDTHTYGALNKADSSIGTNIASTGKHFYLLNQLAGVRKLYQDGVEIASASVSPDAVVHRQILFGGFPGLAFGGFGAGRTPTQAAALSARVATLAASVGW